jgi:hypothetical protein
MTSGATVSHESLLSLSDPCLAGLLELPLSKHYYLFVQSGVTHCSAFHRMRCLLRHGSGVPGVLPAGPGWRERSVDGKAWQPV